MAGTLTKALCAIGVSGSIAGATTAGILMFPSTLAQDLKKKGYHLISEVDTSKKDTLFEAKWTKYKQETNKSDTFSKNEEHKTIKKSDFIKLCTNYENSNDSSYKDRVIKWCTLNIADQVTTIEGKQYITGEKTDQNWTNKYNSSKANTSIKTLIGLSGTSETDAGSKLHDWCVETKEKAYFNDTKNILQNVKSFCLT